MEHASGDIPRRESLDSPPALGVQVRARGADGAHELGAYGRREDLGVVKVVCVAEEGVRDGQREEEDAVDHGAKDGTAAGLVDAEAAWDGRSGILGGGWEKRGRYDHVGEGGAGEGGFSVN
jgi:hypothetical protein